MALTSLAVARPRYRPTRAAPNLFPNTFWWMRKGPAPRPSRLVRRRVWLRCRTPRPWSRPVFYVKKTRERIIVTSGGQRSKMILSRRITLRRFAIFGNGSTPSSRNVRRPVYTPTSKTHSNRREWGAGDLFFAPPVRPPFGTRSRPVCWQTPAQTYRYDYDDVDVRIDLFTEIVSSYY